MSKPFPLKFQLLFLVALTLITYVNTFNHGYSLDDFLLSDNLPPVEEGWQGTLKVFTSAYNFFDYRPIAIYTYAIEQQIQGELSPRTSHIINVLMYLACCLILFVTLRNLPVNNAGLIAFFATAVFIVHPIHSNVVSSLKNRDSIMSLMLGLLSILAALKFVRYQHEKKTKEIAVKVLLMVGAVVLFLIATTAKLDAVSFIILLPLTLLIFSKNRMWMLYSGGLAYVVYRLFTFIRFKIIGPRFLESITTEESILVTENTMMFYDTMSVKVSAALISLFYYIKFHLIPTGYYYYFGFDMIPVDQIFIWQNILAGVVAIISFGAFIYYFLKRPEISFGIGFFYGGLAYCLNLYTPIAGIVAPRLAFIASVGFSLLLAIAILGFARLVHDKMFKDKVKLARVQYASLGLILLLFIPFTIDRNKDWKDLQTLIRADIEHLDRSFEGQRIACMNFLDKSKWVTDEDEALELIRSSLKYCTRASKVYSQDQYVEETIGLALFKLGKYQQSYVQFKKVLNNFERTEIGNEYLGDLFIYSNRPDSAALYFKKLIEIAPDYYGGHFKYTQAMVQDNKVDEAIRENRKFAEQYSDYHFAYESLGYLTLLKGDTTAATNLFFIARDKGSPNYQYMESLEPFFKDESQRLIWEEFVNGKRLPLD